MRKKDIYRYGVPAAVATGILLLNACSAKIPSGTSAVQDFDLNRYLGQWYEIARFDYRFERNMSHVTANYSLNDDGSVKVVNRGFDEKKQEWKQSTGKAKPAGRENEGRFRVSFFKPIWAGYNVLAIDPGYKNALVAGNNRNYLWLLSREKEMPEDVRRAYTQYADSLGFDTSKLIWVKQ